MKTKTFTVYSLYDLVLIDLTDSNAFSCARSVLNWFGALYQVGKEFTIKLDLEKPNWKVPDYMLYTRHCTFYPFIGRTEIMLYTIK